LLDFNEDDLEQNRQGVLSPRQKANLQKVSPVLWPVLGCSGLSISIPVVGVGFLFVSLIVQSVLGTKVTSGTALAVFVFVVVLWGVAGFLLIRFGQSRLSAVPTLVSSLTGHAVVGNLTTPRQQTLGKLHRYVAVGAQEFVLPDQVTQHIDPNAMYTAYFISYPGGVNRIVSMIDADPSIVNTSLAAKADPGIVQASALSITSPLAGQQQELQQALGFTSDELAANRNGQLTPGQIEKLSRSVRGQETGCLILIPIISFFAAVVGFGIGQTWVAGVATLIMALIILAILYLFVVRRSGRTLHSGMVRKITGIASVRVSTSRSASSSTTSYIVQIGSESFFVSRQVYAAFKEGKSYTVYYVVLVGQSIVSADVLD